MAKAQVSDMSDTDLLKMESTGDYYERWHARDERYRRQNERVRCGHVVGDVIDFVRYGTPVENSRNYRDATTEEGMSVYLLSGGVVQFVGFWFDIASRPAYQGRGEIVGWGSDGEPLVRVVGDCVRAVDFDRATA